MGKSGDASCGRKPRPAKSPSCPGGNPRPAFLQELHTKRRGELAELAFAHRAASHGLVVSKPHGECQRYDYIVDNGRRLLRVQVKCTTQFIEGAWRANAHRRLPAGAVAYQPSEVDFFAIYILPEDTWYIIPLKAVLGMTSLFFAAKDSHRRCHHDHFREAWELLCESP